MIPILETNLDGAKYGPEDRKPLAPDASEREFPEGSPVNDQPEKRERVEVPPVFASADYFD